MQTTTKEPLDKVQHSFKLKKKILRELEVGRTISLMKDICKNPANIVFNGEIFYAFLLRSGTGQGYLPLPLQI